MAALGFAFGTAWNCPPLQLDGVGAGSPGQDLLAVPVPARHKLLGGGLSQGQGGLPIMWQGGGVRVDPGLYCATC